MAKSNGSLLHTMASEVVATGSSAEGLTPAQQLMQQHDHHATVEDVVDEDDVAPGQSSAAPQSETTENSATPLGEKAAGKQKADGTTKKATNATLNTASEEAFPALGPVKPRAQAAVAPAWGKKPASLAANGINGSGSASRASTPASGPATPASLPASRGPALPSMALPGKHKEHISFYNSDLKPVRDLKKPIPQIIHDINKRSKARLERRETPNGVAFEATGPSKDVRQALVDVANEVLAKVRGLTFNVVLKLTLRSKLLSSPFLLRFVLSLLAAAVTRLRRLAAALAHVCRFLSRMFKMRTMKWTCLSKAMLSRQASPVKKSCKLSKSALQL